MIPNLVYTTPNASLHGRHYWYMEKNMIDLEWLKKAGMTSEGAKIGTEEFEKTLKEANMNYCEEQQLDALRTENEELKREIVNLKEENGILKEVEKNLNEYKIKCIAYEKVIDAIKRI